MAFGLNRTRYSPIAVDFGDHSLKLLQIVPGDPPRLLATGVAEIPADDTDRWGFYAEAVRRLMRESPFKGNSAVCTTPAHQTLIQHLQIAGNDGGDLASAVGEELRHRLNIDPSRMVVRHFPVGQFARKGSSRQEVICVAASRDTVMRHINILKNVGLDVAGIYSEPQAVIQSFAHLYRRKDDRDRTTCFIDLGASTVKVVVAHGTEMVFAKTIHHVAMGSTTGPETDQPAKPDVDDVAHGPTIGSERLVDESPTTVPGASSERRGAAESVGRGEPARRSGLAVLDVPAEAAVETAAPGDSPAERDGVFDCLIDELQLCLRYHQGMFSERQVEKVVFLGGGARQKQNCERIAKALRIAAQLGDPLARLVRSETSSSPGELDMRQPQPGWAVPMGLCLSQV